MSVHKNQQGLSLGWLNLPRLSAILIFARHNRRRFLTALSSTFGCKLFSPQELAGMSTVDIRPLYVQCVNGKTVILFVPCMLWLEDVIAELKYVFPPCVLSGRNGQCTDKLADWILPTLSIHSDP